METLARADPWASMRVVDDEDDERNRASSPLMTRARRAATKRTVTTQKTRMGRADADEDDDDDDDDEEAAMTASEGDDDKEEEDEEEETKRGARTRRRKTVKFREEAENASLAVMAKRRRAPAMTTPGKKVAVRDEVEKINARTSGPLAPRTNEKGVQDAREMRESADDSFATADPWGAPPSMERQSRQVSASRRGRDELPPSPSRYEPTTPKVKAGKRKTAPKEPASSPQRAFGSPTAIVSPASAPLRADTAEGLAYVCPGPPIPPERECYLGLWRGEERARLLAYEACVQTCLDGSTGSFVGQSRFDVQTWLFFLNDRCAKLREAFGLENVLVSTMGQQCATPEMKSRPTLDKEASAEAVSVGAGAGGVRWAAITVSIVAVVGSPGVALHSAAERFGSPIDGGAGLSSFFSLSLSPPNSLANMFVHAVVNCAARCCARSR